MGCFNMHRFNLSMHILHVFIQEFEMFLNLYCGLGRHANARSRSKARPLHLTRVGLLLLDLYISVDRHPPVETF